MARDTRGSGIGTNAIAGLMALLLAMWIAPGVARASALPGVRLARLAPSLQMPAVSVGHEPVQLTASLHRKRGTALVFGGILAGAGGAVLALPVAFMMATMTLINPAALAIGLGMIAGGTVLAILGGRDLHRYQILAREEGEGGQETAGLEPWLDSVPPPGVIPVPLLRF